MIRVTSRRYPFTGCFAGVLILVAGIAPVRGFDFRLYPATIKEDGFVRELSCFHPDEHTRIAVSLPRGWKETADSTSLTLTCPKLPGSTIRLETSALGPGQSFQGKALDTYRKRALSILPDGAENVRITQESNDPLPIFHWKGYEFVIDYVFYGEAYRRSILFLDLNAAEQITASALAPKAAYDGVHDAAFDLLRSWQVLPEE